METFREIVQTQMKLLFSQLNGNSYLAHICPDKNPETLKEHTEKVVEYACLLIEQHNLEEVIDHLMAEIVGEDREVSRYELKRIFGAVFVFHDTGKVNVNFQAMRMQHSGFHSRKTEVLQPPHGHSFLGSWLFLAFMLEQLWEEQRLTEKEKKTLFVYAFFFSHIIRQHHCSGLGWAAQEEFLESFSGVYDELQEYLHLWGHQGNWERIEAVLKYVLVIRDEVARKFSFPLYALIKLNFSLLTAADYLATHEYMNGSPVHDLGVFNNRERVGEIIRHFRSYKHNKLIYAEVGHLVFRHPREKSGENLNVLRTEMAVEVIRTIRKNLDQWLFYIEAPTGGGKTNLSMIAVTELLEKHPGIQKIFYVFPFTTLVTQTYQTLQKALGLTASELAELHAKAALNEEVEQKEDGLYADKKQNYIDRLFALYPVCVLSHVKFFDILKSSRKEADYLFHRLANSVVVIDELQTYNPILWDKMYYLIEQYARVFNMRFILMSATLPKIDKLNVPLEKKGEFIDLLPQARKYVLNPNFAQRVKFRFDLFQEDLDIAELAEFVTAKSEEYARTRSPYGTVHTIIELIFKKSASEFYARIRECTSFFDEVLVLSGTILESRRREVIYDLKNPAHRAKNVLLITTQVVEAGVDIDMDLGFKNISLVDSDEQLAGRVNRNSLKEGCEVYLFRLDDAGVLYGGDKRYQIVREAIAPEDYERILENKDFGCLYEAVFKKIDQLNEHTLVQNFRTKFLPGIESLDYPAVDKNFQIIAQKNMAVFVPLSIPVEIDTAEEGGKEKLFSETELRFLSQFGVMPEKGLLSGMKVWEVYERFIHASDRKSFNLERQVDFRILQRILSWFTFSLIYQGKELSELRCGLGEEKLGYFYFSHWDEEDMNGPLYDYEMGLNTKAFKDIAFI